MTHTVIQCMLATFIAYRDLLRLVYIAAINVQQNNFVTGRLALIKYISIGEESLRGFDSKASQIYSVSPTTRHRYDLSSELCCPDAKPRSWTPSLQTRFGVILRV